MKLKEWASVIRDVALVSSTQTGNFVLRGPANEKLNLKTFPGLEEQDKESRIRALVDVGKFIQFPGFNLLFNPRHVSAIRADGQAVEFLGKSGKVFYRNPFPDEADIKQALNQIAAMPNSSFTLSSNSSGLVNTGNKTAVAEPESAPESGPTPEPEHPKPGLPAPTPRAIKDHLDRNVIGQEDAKKKLAVAVYNHSKRIAQKDAPASGGVRLEKSNILMIGPTGTGKTLLAETLAKALNVPFVKADASALTESGYIGGKAEDIIADLLDAAGGDAEKAATGIVYIDEIDKIKKSGRELGRDVSGEGAQKTLLTLLEGKELEIYVAKNKSVKVNTRNILFICGGAFVGLDEVVAARLKEKKHGTEIGFNAAARKKSTPLSVDELNAQANTEDIVNFGMMPELLGRLPVTTVLRSLGVEELLDILTKPENAPVRQYQHLLDLDGITLAFEPEALRSIAEKALELKKGARGVRAIMEEILLDVMFEAPEMENGSTYTVTKGMVGAAAEAAAKKEAANGNEVSAVPAPSRGVPQPGVK